MSGFSCTKCGDCCRGFDEAEGVVLVRSDVARLARGLGQTIKAVLSKYCTRISVVKSGQRFGLHKLKAIKGECVFLSVDGKCKVHRVKPVQCRRGPWGFFWDGMPRWSCMEGLRGPPERSRRAADAWFVRRIEEFQV
jgi:Fe-S-cluster containining protein